MGDIADCIMDGGLADFFQGGGDLQAGYTPATYAGRGGTMYCPICNSAFIGTRERHIKRAHDLPTGGDGDV